MEGSIAGDTETGIWVNVFAQLPALLASLPPVKHVVHVGAHEGQEVPYYREAGIEKITLVEPIPQLAQQLRDRFPDAFVVEAAIGTQAGTAKFFIMERSNLSTLQKPGKQDRVQLEITVPVVPLKTVAPGADFAVIDAQGRELDVLYSADLRGFKIVIVETCTVKDPTMASWYPDVVEFMEGAGFEERTLWARDYQWLFKWARRRPTSTSGEVRDVVFVKCE